MITIETDGRRTEGERQVGRELTRDEILAELGGPWKIEGLVRYPQGTGPWHYMLCRAGAFATQMQNMEASRVLGRMVWGRAVLLVRGEEMR